MIRWRLVVVTYSLGFALGVAWAYDVPIIVLAMLAGFGSLVGNYVWNEELKRVGYWYTQWRAMDIAAKSLEQRVNALEKGDPNEGKGEG